MIKDEAKKILELVGGKKNVNSLVHCATRLRFSLKDEKLAQKQELEKLPYVLSVVQSGGQYQVVIGPKVSDYYAVIMEMLGDNVEKNQDSEKFSLIKIISGAFTPLIPILAGAGMLKALLTVLETVHWIDPKGATYAVLAAAGNAVFYFLPIFLGITLSKQFKADPFVGGALGAALLEPNFTALIGKKGLDLLGLNLTAVDYATTVFPIFIIAIVYAFLNKWLKRIIPKELQLFLNPMIALLILVPATVLVFGPFGTNIGNAVSQGIMWLFGVNKFVAGLFLGALYPFLTILGLHWGFTPITLQNLNLYGGDVIEGVAVCTVYAQIGIALGVYLKSRKHSQMKELAGPTLLTGLLAGVTEPILYGIIVQSKRLLAIVAIAGGVGGAINGLFGVKMTAYVFHNIFSLAMMSYSPINYMLIGIGVSLLTGTLLTYFWGYRPNEEKDNSSQVESQLSNQSVISASLEGKVILQKDIQDEVFASGSVGSGIAIEPQNGVVKAPFDGEVISVFPTKHAIGLRSNTGVELLIHVGLNTVMLNGKFFETLVQDGDKIAKGDELLHFELENLKEAGYQMQVPILVTNIDPKQVDILVSSEQILKYSTNILKVNKSEEMK